MEAYKKADRVVKQLYRQLDKWFAENSKDQGNLKALFEKREALDAEIEAKKAELAIENRTQINQYSQLIRDAEAARDKLNA